MLTFLETILLGIFIAVLVFVSHLIGQVAPTWMPIEATAEGQKIDQLFSFLVSVGAFIFIGVAGVILYSMLFFRAPKTDYSEGHPSRGDARIEILWTAVPTVLVLWIAIQGLNIYGQLHISGLTILAMHAPHISIEEPAEATTPNNNTSEQPTQQIEVIAKQWVWSFRYPGNLTSQELHLPVNQSTNLVLQSQDVIHGFYVPAFRLKQDIIPNHTFSIIVTPIKTGKYRLNDSQFSGTYFAVMQADVYVDSPEDYNKWLTQTASAPISSNQALAEYNEPRKKILNSGWESISPAES